MLPRLACVFILLASELCLVCSSNASTVGESACTNGFIPLERLQAWSATGSAQYFHWRQWLFPNINFTCSGRITKWTVAGQYQQNSARNHPRLQVWREGLIPDEYDVVGYTDLEFMEYDSKRIYEYQLEYPIEFETGDLFGLYDPFQSTTNLNILFENTASDLQRESLFVYAADRPLTTFTVASMRSPPTIYERSHEVWPMVAVEVETDEEGVVCTSGFMPLQRLELVAPVLRQSQQQLIIPDMGFTCSGSIISWTVAGMYKTSSFFSSFPEIQIWRRVRLPNETEFTQEYVKVGTVVLSVPYETANRLYTGEVVPPVEVRGGDIFGLFLPVFNLNRMEVYFEETDEGPTNFAVSSPMLENLDVFVVSERTTLYIAQRRPLIVVALDTTAALSTSSIAPSQSRSSRALPETQALSTVLSGASSLRVTAAQSTHREELSESEVPILQTPVPSEIMPTSSFKLSSPFILTTQVIYTSQSVYTSKQDTHVSQTSIVISYEVTSSEAAATSMQETSVYQTPTSVSTYNERSTAVSSTRLLQNSVSTSTSQQQLLPTSAAVSTTSLVIGPTPEDAAENPRTLLIIIVASASVGFILIIALLALLVLITALKVAAPKRVYQTSEGLRRGRKWSQPQPVMPTTTTTTTTTGSGSANGTNHNANSAAPENTTHLDLPRDEANGDTHECTQYALETASPVILEPIIDAQGSDVLPVVVSVPTGEHSGEWGATASAEGNEQPDVAMPQNIAAEMEEDQKEDVSL